MQIINNPTYTTGSNNDVILLYSMMLFEQYAQNNSMQRLR